MGVIGKLDTYQRRHRWLGLPIAVIYKFVDDQGTYLASLITYYGFLSLFPLLLIFTTVLGFMLHGHPALQHELISSALGQFPVIGDQLTDTAHPLHGSGTGLVIGILVALYGGLGFSVAIQNAFNQVWAVPMTRRPDLVVARLRGLALLGVLCIGVLVTTGLAGLTTWAGDYGPEWDLALRAGATVLAVIVNGVLLVLAFRVLTARHLTVRQVLPGAVVAALAWQVLQSLGTLLVGHELRGTSQVYGLFGLVLGLLAWIYLEALVVVFAAELNAVRSERLWPRALLALTPLVDNDELTHADRRSYRSYATAQRYKDFEEITVEFDPPTERDRRP